MSCNDRVTVEEKIVCAVTCFEKFNDAPISEFRFDSFVLFDNSQYFDSGDISIRQVRWSIYTEGVLIYDFGFGDYYDSISELSNGSTYSQLVLGELNEDILAFIESLPNTIIPNGASLYLVLDVKDNTGIPSENISNKYYFSK